MPKSASVIWACASDELRAAIDRMALDAARKVISFIQDHCGFCRVGKGGQSLECVPLLFAIFPQSVSRESDPHHHLHMLFLNITRKADGNTRAVDSTHLYHYQKAAGALYRVCLAEGFQRLGFEVEVVEKGRHRFFEIRGVPEELAREFAKRTATIEAEAERRHGSLQAADAEDRERLRTRTKKAKRELVRPRDELFAEWREVAARFGITQESIERLRAGHRPVAAQETERRKEEVFHEAVSRLEDAQSHFDRADIVEHVAEESQGKLSFHAALELIEEKLSGSTLMHLGGMVTKPRSHAERVYMERIEERFTTHANWMMEEAMRDAALALARERNPIDQRHVEEAIARRPSIKDDQERAVRYLCDGPNIRAMTGNAGTGKTFTLQAVREAYEAAGRTVVGCALQGSAAEELEAKSGIPSDTLRRTLYRLDKGYLHFDEKTVVVLDEAGMVGTVKMTRLLQHAARAGAKVLLVGDAKQLQPIEAGGPFKHLCGLIGDVLLKKILRQADPTRHAAIEDFAYGRSREALADFIRRGELHELSTKADAIDRMVERWVVDGGPLKPERVSMLANLNHDVRTINRKCQAIRIELGRVNPERTIAANGELFHEGDILQFAKIDRTRGIQNANTGTILAVDEASETLTVRLDKDARVLDIPVKEYGPENIRLGYSRTTHKSQGKSFERAHVLIGGSLSNRHSAYVQASRAIYKTELYVSSDQAGPEYRDLCRVLARDRAKDLAHDVAEAQVRSGHQARPHPRSLAVPVGR